MYYFCTLGIQDIFEFGARELKGPAAAERLLAQFFTIAKSTIIFLPIQTDSSFSKFMRYPFHKMNPTFVKPT